ncbi:MAG TPA: DUF3558 family protein [Gemmatimonadales bacterium]|nr:DUF3558 family protein [Gemmatimonadales bacterium]
MRNIALATLLGLVALTACSKPSRAQRGPDSGSASSDVSAIDACALLTQAEIQQVLGVAMKPGVKQTTEDSSQCQWDSQNEGDAAGVSVSVARYDDKLYRTMSSAQAAKPVSGFGEAAYKDYPHVGDIAIKHDGHEIDIGVVDFKLSNEKVDAAAATFAKLVLSRVS